MNYYDNNFLITSKFGDRRDYGFHEGNDYWHKNLKNTDIINIYNGVLEYINYEDNPSESYGYRVCIRSNPKYLNGIDCDIYVRYSHLHKIDNGIIQKVKQPLAKNRYIKKGTPVGKMGNTGTCYTRNTKTKWRKVTEEEKKDPAFKGGVHLHLDFQVKTRIAAEELNRAIKDKTNFYGEAFITQWDFYYFHPLAIEKYYNKLRLEEIEKQKERDKTLKQRVKEK
jgi:murein DD-endopeptidase MepM/ murein hydrolase activator NlpD